MAYSQSGLIEATDYNTFVSTGTPNINNIWGTGSGDSGWGQTAINTVATADTVSATQWASLVNTLSSMGSQTNTTITSRTAPVTGNTISVLANVSADITSVNTNRGFAAASGTTSTTWTDSTAKTTATGSAGTTWTITWTHTVTFASANAARYFWNAGGLVRLDMSKSSTGTDSDADWNTFIGTVGTLYMSGRVNSANQLIAGTTYTGFTRIGGSGTPSPNLTTTGWYSLTAGAAANDELSIVAFGSFSVQGTNTQNTISTYYYTTTAGQTTVGGSDIYGRTLSYMQDGLIVVRNGSTLRNKIDYSATNGTNISCL